MIKLGEAAYKKLCQKVYLRDSKKCRCCHTRDNITFHHIIKRSKERIDTTYNLITLCFICHRDIENREILLIGKDANKEIRFVTP